MTVSKLRVRVTGVIPVAPAIREFRLEPIEAQLTPFSAGSHVIVEMPGAGRVLRNAYSLLSDPADTGAYRIAVRLQESSRGGSKFMHEQVSEGTELLISPPANLFAPSWQGRKHLLIAGGVGITPFLSYIPEMLRRDADFELHYLYRSSQTGAYREALADQLGERYFGYDSATGERCRLEKVLGGRAPGTHVYVCGPQSLLEAVRRTAAELGWPASHIHFEAFAAAQPGEPFQVELAASRQRLEVPGESSLLEALEDAGINVPSLCRGGVCGQCMTRVLDGDIEHRDSFLSEAEKARQDCIMPCVSRAAKAGLTLDL
ncbi:PDR/VanB family oxidoreductase [Marinobacterium rhizophilum]|uniref:PDR/VanB family oxidoreductase n=1 Tax=Marinobacterium rhizophilum TaxID=420402 RepID=UPI00036302D1|nr:PDR/VanB family oxidoreductase [Marinobacterium rhizophilum]